MSSSSRNDSEPHLVTAEDEFPEVFSRNKNFNSVTVEGELGDVRLDLKNLLIMGLHAPLNTILRDEREEIINSTAQRGAQLLINALMALPGRNAESGLVVELPVQEKVCIPRAKPSPQSKPETKWEKFAKAKGITKRKRSRKVWDESAQEWRPLWGYKRANPGVESAPIVEVKQGENFDTDPWTEAKAAKRSRVEKNAKQMKRNSEKLSSTIPPLYNNNTTSKSDHHLGIPVDLGNSNPQKRGKRNTAAALGIVQRSTASLGRFDERRPGEKEIHEINKRRSFKSAVMPAQEEMQMADSILRRVVTKNAKSKQAGIGAIDSAKSQTRSDIAFYDAVHGGEEDRKRKRKGFAGVGKAKKVTKKRAGH